MVQATRVADYVFTSPRPWKTLPLALLLSLLLGALSLPGWGWREWLLASLGLFFTPAALGSFLALPLTRAVGGRIYLRRSALLAVISLLILLPLLAAWRGLLEPRFGARLSDVMLFSWALVLWLWHLVLLTTAITRHARALAPSAVMPLSGCASVALLLPPFGARELVLFMGFASVFLLSASAFKKMAESPLRRNFGASGMELVRSMLAHWTEGGDAGKGEMEEFFSTFSVPFRADVGVVGFKAGERLKALWVIPSVHPGPFGGLGGSDLPSKLRRELETRSGGGPAAAPLMVFHGAATHDQNPASDSDVSGLASAALSALKKLKFHKAAGGFRRFEGERVALCVQPLGGSVLAVHTSAPAPTDDVDHAVGVIVRSTFGRHGYGPALFIDAHNCLERGGGAVHSGSPEAEELMRVAEEAARSTREASSGPVSVLRAGFAQTAGFHTERDGIGPQGVQVAVLEAGGKTVAYILFDGNNMVRGLREKVLGGIRGIVDEAEVYTTDNHVVHATMGGYNPVGARYPHDELVRVTRETLQRALEDMEEVEVGVGLEGADIRVFGPGNTARLTTAINSTVAILRTSVTVCLMGAFLGCFALYWLVEAAL
ncbi:MAG: DUF2070 family protein [Thermoplasmatota archaeon]